MKTQLNTYQNNTLLTFLDTKKQIGSWVEDITFIKNK